MQGRTGRFTLPDTAGVFASPSSSYTELDNARGGRACATCAVKPGAAAAENLRCRPKAADKQEKG
jgi:hypothetical protein